MTRIQLPNRKQMVSNLFAKQTNSIRQENERVQTFREKSKKSIMRSFPTNNLKTIVYPFTFQSIGSNDVSSLIFSAFDFLCKNARRW